MLGDEEELDVKTKPVDSHQVQQRTKLLHIKCLEPALRVHEPQSRHSFDDQVHHTSALLAPPWLVRADQRTVKGPRAKRDIDFSSNYRPRQFCQFLDRR